MNNTLRFYISVCLAACCKAADLMYMRSLDADDPLAIAHSDLLEWCERPESKTYLEGWMLHQELLMQIDVERLLYYNPPARAAQEAA